MTCFRGRRTQHEPWNIRDRVFVSTFEGYFSTEEHCRALDDVGNLIVMGGGPAGYTAALYAPRANLGPLVIEGFSWGGQLMMTSGVVYNPCCAAGVVGTGLMQC